MKIKRNIYTKEFEELIKSKAKDCTKKELCEIAEEYGYPMTKKKMEQFLDKRNIKFKDFNPRYSKNMGDKIPIGTEIRRKDGRIAIKISKDGWIYKHRYIYEQYYKVKLTSNDYIIFLDRNKNNFDISNLKRITINDNGIIGGYKMYSKNSELTELATVVAQIINKTNERKKQYE